MTKVLKTNNEGSNREISEIPKMLRKVPKRNFQNTTSPANACEKEKGSCFAIQAASFTFDEKDWKNLDEKKGIFVAASVGAARRAAVL